MDGEDRRLDVDGTTYRLRPWSYKDGRRWLFRLVTIAASARASASVSEMAAVGKLLEELDERTFEELCDTCERYTDVVSMDGGREGLVPLTKIVATHMPGRYVDLGMLLRAHLEAEFAPFFSRVGEVFAGLVERKGS
jgi:hypothetical protein